MLQQPEGCRALPEHRDKNLVVALIVKLLTEILRMISNHCIFSADTQQPPQILWASCCSPLQLPSAAGAGNLETTFLYGMVRKAMEKGRWRVLSQSSVGSLIPAGQNNGTSSLSKAELEVGATPLRVSFAPKSTGEADFGEPQRAPTGKCPGWLWYRGNKR